MAEQDFRVKNGLVVGANTVTFGSAAYIVANGNVGIAKTPTQKLDVAGTVKTNTSFMFGSDENLIYQASADNVNMRVGTGANTAYFGFKSQSGGPVLDAPSGALLLGTSGVERMRIDSSGNVGVGTTAVAGGRMQVNGQVSDTDGTGLDQGQLLITDSDNSTTSGLMVGYRWTAGVAEYGRIQCRNAIGATNLVIQAGGGNVGIGTSSPSSRLDVNSLVTLSGTEDNQLRWLLSGKDWRANISAGGNWYLLDKTNSKFPFTIEGNSPNDSLRITSAGNVGIGASSAYPSTIGNVRLTLTGGIAYNYQSGPAGYGLYNGGATAEWFIGQRSASDHSFKICMVVSTNVYERFIISTSGVVTAPGVYSTSVIPSRVVYTDTAGNLGYYASILAAKTNVADLIDTDWLAALHPVTFNYRKLDEDRNYTDEAEADLEYGLIAEEVEGVNNELVFYDETENGLELRGVHYNKLIVPLLAEVQKLRAELTDTKARLAALETNP